MHHSLKINYDLLPMKGHYFLWNAGAASVLSFMSVYAGQLGFSSSTVGIIYTVLPLSGVLFKLLMGYIADKFKCQKLIFLLAQIVGAAGFFSLIFLPEVSTTIIPSYSNEINDGEDFYLKYQFWLLFIAYLVAWNGQAVTVSVGDTICFQLLGDKPHKYGYQRMYGSLGWGLSAIVAGLLVDYFSEDDTKKNYTPTFSIGVGIMLLSVIVSYQIKYQQQFTSASIFKDIGRLFTNIRIIIFIFWCTCIGLCTALIWNFLFWLLEELAANHGSETQAWIKTIEGLVMGIQSLGGELPFFFLSSWILKKIGHIHAMSLVLLVTGIRFLLYSFLTNPWYCLPIEVCNGFTFGLFYATMTSYASIIAPSGAETTMQGLVGAVFEGVGVSIGSFIGGLLIEEYGGSLTFRIFGFSVLIVCVLHAGLQCIIHRTIDEDKGRTKFLPESLF